MPSAYILYIAICKLGHQQEPGLIILFKVDKGLKIGLYGAVLLLYLAIYLKIKGGWESLLDVKEIIKQWPELRGEKQAFIGNN